MQVPVPKHTIGIKFFLDNDYFQELLKRIGKKTRYLYLVSPVHKILFFSEDCDAFVFKISKINITKWLFFFKNFANFEIF